MNKLLLLFMCCAVATGYGQKTPTLHVGKKQLSLSSLDVKVAIIGNTATTTYDMLFYNPSNRVLEGNLKFPLSENHEISRLALEMNGKLREAVVVNKELGRIAFEGIVRRGVDPALLEKGSGNTYNVRVYPIPAKGYKRVIIAYEQELLYKEKAHYYHLPLGFKTRLDNFKVEIEAVNHSQKPVLVEGEEIMFFSKWKNSFKTTLEKKNYIANNSILVKIPVAFKDEVLITSPNYFYFYKTLQPQYNKRQKPKKINLFWDVSLSMKNRNIEKEITLFDEYFSNLKNVKIHLISFSNIILNKENFIIKNGNWDALKEKLQNTVYDGGTSYIDIKNNIETADANILSSDGLTTLSEVSFVKNVPVFIINSNAESAHKEMFYIAKKAKGAYINLNITSLKEALLSLNSIPLEYLGYRSKNQKLSIYPSVSSKGLLDFSVAGKNYQAGEKITFLFGYGNEIAIEIPVEIKNETALKNDKIQRIWAKNKLQSLVKNKKENKKKIIELATEYSLVTDYTSLIVLESVYDYVKYNITPPEELMDEFNRIRNNKIKTKQEFVQRNNRPIPPTSSERIEIVEDEKEVEETVIESTESDESEIVQAESIMEISEVEEVEEVIEDVPFTVIESVPIFSGCNEDVSKRSLRNCFSQKIQQHVQTNFNMNLVTGLDVSSGGEKITTQFTIDRLGNVVNIKVRAQHVILANEAVRILQLLPSFSPGSQRGRPVAVSYVLPITVATLEVSNTTNLTPKNPVTVQANVVNIRSNSTVVNGQRNHRASSRKKSSYKKYKGSLKIADRFPKTPYLNALSFFKDKKSAYLFYLTQRESYKNVPHYYIDVSDFFLRKFNSKSIADRILSNVAELELDNYELLKAFAYKLEEQQEYDLALFIYQKILELRPEDAQSYRDLALAYQNLGLCQKAFDIFLDIVTKKIYENNQHRRVFQGLQDIAMTELNQLYQKYESDLDESKIPEEYISKLKSVDFRVVVDWNHNDTDIDLHVIDPNFEECYYSHSTTQQGGKISRDMTQGFGPEVFTLQKAKKGFYYVKIKYYGDRKQKVETPTFMKITIFKNQGKENEEKTVRVVRLTKSDNEEMIAKIEF